MDGDQNLKLSDRDIAHGFSDPLWAERFPPVLSTRQAADLLQVPLDTIYNWRSRGLLGSCSRRVGKHVRFYRDRLIKRIFNEGLADDR
jgi:excisionase family DNA binding protein